MPQIDMLNKNDRLRVLEGIKSEDNHNRKREQQKRFDVFNDRQDIYILERLRREFTQKTVNEMRKILSINLSKRIIKEKSSVYIREPERTFSTGSGLELSENQLLQIENLYNINKVNMALKEANIFKNLHQQCALMVVPGINGKIKVRALPPHQYDVVPDPRDPEIAAAYILNVWDFDTFGTVRSGSGEPNQLNRYRGNDRVNQAIADDDDRQALLKRFTVWTNEVHFTMDGKGNIIGEPIVNPIGRLPFVDVAPINKDSQFFVRRGSSSVDFSLDFGMMLSDNANVIRLQSYSQAVISSEKAPEQMTIGPNHILHLKLDRKAPELNPKFEFVTPSPDLAGTQAFLDAMLNLHLTSEGLDPSVLSSTNQGQKFNSGLDRLLSMISKFEATRDDFDLFTDVESEIAEILSRWSNVFQPVVGEGSLVPQLKLATLPDDLMLSVSFSKPEAVQTRTEQEDSVMKLVDAGFMSRVEAIMELRGLDKNDALKVLEGIDADSSLQVIPDLEELNGETNL